MKKLKKVKKLKKLKKEEVEKKKKEVPTSTSTSSTKLVLAATLTAQQTTEQALTDPDTGMHNGSCCSVGVGWTALSLATCSNFDSCGTRWCWRVLRDRKQVRARSRLMRS